MLKQSAVLVPAQNAQHIQNVNTPTDVAVCDGMVFLGVETAVVSQVSGDAFALSTSDLTVMRTYDSGGSDYYRAAPFVRDGWAYMVNARSQMWKVNCSTGAPDTSFNSSGFPGRAFAGTMAEGGIITDTGVGPTFGYLFLSASGIARVDTQSGAFTKVYTSVNGSAGLAIDRTHRVVAYLSGSQFVEVPLDNTPATVTYSGIPTTDATPAYDPSTNKFFLTTTDGHLYSFPSL